MLKHTKIRTGGGTPLLGASTMKRAFFVLIVLFISINTIFSSSLKWSWITADNNSKYFRYRLNDNEWTVVDSSVRSVSLKRDSLKDTLYVESSYDGINWSEPAVGEFSHSNIALKASFAPYSLAVFDFYNGHQIEGAKAITHTAYGLSAALELDWILFNRFVLYPEFGYSLEIKKETIIPNKKNIHYIKAGAGIDYKSYMTEKDSFSVGLFGGALWHMNNNIANTTPYFGIRTSYERDITGNLILGISSRASFAFLSAEDSLYDSLTILIDPVAISLSYVF